MGNYDEFIRRAMSDPASDGSSGEADDAFTTQTPAATNPPNGPQAYSSTYVNGPADTTNNIPDDAKMGIPANLPQAYKDKLRHVFLNNEVPDQNDAGVGLDNNGRMNDTIVGLPKDQNMKADGYYEGYQVPLGQYKSEILPRLQRSFDANQAINKQNGNPELPDSAPRRAAAEYNELSKNNAVPPQVDDLIAKMASGRATKEEKLQFYNLTARNY